MLRTFVSLIAFVAVLCVLGVAAFASESDYAPAARDLLPITFLDGLTFPPGHAGAAPFVDDREQTIRVLTDEEIAFMAHGTIDADWDAPRDKNRDADLQSFAFAVALGASLQWLASFFDARLAAALLWLGFLALTLRPPRRNTPRGTP